MEQKLEKNRQITNWVIILFCELVLLVFLSIKIFEAKEGKLNAFVFLWVPWHHLILPRDPHPYEGCHGFRFGVKVHQLVEGSPQGHVYGGVEVDHWTSTSIVAWKVSEGFLFETRFRKKKVCCTKSIAWKKSYHTIS